MRRDACRAFGGVAGALCLAAPLSWPREMRENSVPVFRLYLRFLRCSKYRSAVQEGERQGRSGNSEIGQVFYFPLSKKQERMVSKEQKSCSVDVLV